MGRFLRPLLQGLWWLVWDFSGIRFIYEKIVPPDPSESAKRPPATFFLWLVGIYIALFGVASQRYENLLDRIENRANTIYAQLGTSNAQKALELIPRVQAMVRPVKPSIFHPVSVVCSLLCKQVADPETINGLKDIVVTFKDNLEGVSLPGIDLSEADLVGANLRRADLQGANLYNAKLLWGKLHEANLEGAILDDAKLGGAHLTKANLCSASLVDAHLQEANLHEAISGLHRRVECEDGADLKGADLSGANLHGAYLDLAHNLTQRQLNTACVATHAGERTRLPPGLTPPSSPPEACSKWSPKR